MAALTLRGAIARLAKLYGRPPRPPATDPFALVIWENCAYLVDDTRRAAVFAKLKRTVGLDPAKILATPLAGISPTGSYLLACLSPRSYSISMEHSSTPST
jgi:hypothetical protein